MYEFDCPICATRVETTDHRQRACSRTCGQRMRSYTSTRDRVCEVCSSTYRATYKDQRTCGRECGHRLRGNRALVWQWRSILVASSCEACEVLLVSRRGRRFCGAAECYRRGAGMTPRGSWVASTCPDCQLPFSYVQQSNRRTLCDACRRAAQRRGKAKAARGKRGGHYNTRARHVCRLTSADYEPINRARVLERDGWICGICSEPIDPAATYPDLMSPSLDHVMPLAIGGSHTYDNVQAAHFLCNSYKSADEAWHARVA